MAIKDLTGAVTVVTGASSGIGLETARLLAGAGARVALLARRTERLEEVAESIKKDGGDALAMTCDVSDRAAVESAMARAVEAWGPVDALVNNAGFGDPIPVAEARVEDIEQMMRVNYFGAVYGTKAVLDSMLERKRGSIVMVSSVLGHVIFPNMTPYCATKHALSAFGVGLAQELAGTGVTVTNVCPGAIATDFFQTDKWTGKTVGAKNNSPARVARDILLAIRTGPMYVSTPRHMGFLRWLYPTLGPLGRVIARSFSVRDTE